MLNLPVFPAAPTLSPAEIENRLQSGVVRRVIQYALGPAGTNISQAAQKWACEIGINSKSEIVLCATPEQSLEQARLVSEPGVVPMFWTCAVFYALNQLFFSNPDAFPFLVSYNMQLDAMQLCVRKAYAVAKIPSFWRVASHPSPAPLVKGRFGEVIFANSNAHAAQMAADGLVELCVTTAQAAAIHQLYTLHEFGSPVMVFFGGTTEHGMRVLRSSQ